MRKSAAVVLLAALLGVLGLVAWVVPASGQPGTITITGTVIDLYCYAQNKEHTGKDHGASRECAWACLKYTGMPPGILTSEGRSYEIVGGLVADNNAKIAPHVNQRVTITGKLGELNGMPTISANDLTVVK